jgi:PadR family transcriptional regulator PadR
MPRWRGRQQQDELDSMAGRPRRIRRFIEPALLLLLHCNPTHGYALIEGLSDLGLEAYPADASAIYRILYDLEAKGMLVSTQDAAQSAGPPRRVYTLTEAGDVYLKSWVQDLRETNRLLHHFLEAYDAHQKRHERIAT